MSSSKLELSRLLLRICGDMLQGHSKDLDQM